MNNPYRIREARVKKRVKIIAVADCPMDIVNPVTGEVRRATPYMGSRRFRDTSDFVKMYDLKSIGMLSQREFKVFCWILDELDYTGTVTFSGERCKDEMGFKTERSAYYGLKGLVDKDFVRKDKKGLYWVNPNIAFKGSRDELLELSMASRYEEGDSVQ